MSLIKCRQCFRGLCGRILCLLAVCVAVTGAAVANPPDDEDLRVEKVVVLMRHGARAGLDTAAIARTSRRQWPEFGYADGDLTAHGRSALLLWGQYHRQRWARQGLLPESGRIAANSVVAFASPSQRARDSADVFMAGVNPGNDTVTIHEGTGPWFLTSSSSLANAPPAEVLQAIEGGLGMSLAAAQALHRPALRLLESQLQQPEGTLSNRPWRMDVAHGFHLTPLDRVDNLVEIVRMQYVGNFPLPDVGFGNVANQAALADLMSLRATYYNATCHPRYLAVRRGQALLRQMSDSLIPRSASNAEGGGPAISLYVGHDSNLAAARATFGFDWHIPEHLPNDPPPGSMMVFERLRRLTTGEQFIRLSFHSQTNDQIRGLVALESAAYGNQADQPFVRVYETPGSQASPANQLIPLADFDAIVQQALHDAADPAPSPDPQEEQTAAAAAPVPFERDPWEGSSAGFHFPGFMINPFINPFTR